jgi:hypothetical protein
MQFLASSGVAAAAGGAGNQLLPRLPQYASLPAKKPLFSAVTGGALYRAAISQSLAKERLWY